MLIKFNGPKYTPPQHFEARKTAFIDKDFQIKYTLLVISAAIFGMIFGLLPIYYFLNQNYQIFVELAYEYSPELIRYLENERVWMNTFLFSIFSGLIVFFSVIGFKMTGRIAGPLHVLKNHIQQLSRGNWTLKSIKVRDNDEFQDLIEAYNYFYNSFVTNAERELELLQQFSLSKDNLDAYNAWIELMMEKQEQLDKIPDLVHLSDYAAGDFESPDSRHVS